jgi:hypothetical protein
VKIRCKNSTATRVRIMPEERICMGSERANSGRYCRTTWLESMLEMSSRGSPREIISVTHSSSCALTIPAKTQTARKSHRTLMMVVVNEQVPGYN